jgi:hypothetical protein
MTLKSAWLGVALVALAATGAVAATGRNTAASNRAAAQADAISLLATVNLPPGARRLTRKPGGTGTWLSAPANAPATPNLIDGTQWWEYDGTPQSLLSYVRAHRPAGSSLSMAGSGRGTYLAVSYAWPPVAGVLSLRQVSLGVVAMHGRSIARVDAEDVWVSPRPVTERIPGNISRLTLEVKRGNVVRQGPQVFASRARIDKVVSVLNQLPRAQPGVSACPVDPGIVVVLKFFTARSQTPEAVAVIDPYGCGGVSLTLNGRRQPELASGPIPGEPAATTLTRVLQRDLGVRIRIGVSRPASR